MQLLSLIGLALLAVVNASPNPIPPDKFIDKRPGPTSTSNPPKPWIRTVSGEVELVTPTVIGGITFSASPRNVKTPTPWVSIKKDGIAKTITPKVKGAETKNAAPDYDTWFDTPVTVTHDLSEKKMKGGGDSKANKNKIHKEVKMIPEDQTNAGLNPLIRCTPDRYFSRKGEKKNSGPFCTPHQNSHVLLDKTHWVSWYTHFFDDPSDKVRIHMAYVEDKGVDIAKRQLSDDKNTALDTGFKNKRDTEASFFTTEWRENDGFFPLEIEQDWLLGKYEQLISLSIQPESIDDEDFDLLNNGTILRIRQGPTVIKQSMEEKMVLKPSKDGLTMAFLAVPSVMMVFFFAYMVFVWATRDMRNFSGIRKASMRRRKKGGYERLNNTYEMT